MSAHNQPNNKAIKLTIENQEDKKIPKNRATVREQYLTLQTSSRQSNPSKRRTTCQKPAIKISARSNSE